MAETSKAIARRLRDGFFDRYIKGKGIDIGCGTDLISPTCDKWDYSLGHGDATFMSGITDETYDYVYSSHCLEHLIDPIQGLKNWWRILKPGGHLIISIPHRDVYEKRTTLPSRWNPDHKTFWLIDKSEPPCTFGIIPTITNNLTDYIIHSVSLQQDGTTNQDKPDEHCHWECSIEIILQKKLK